MQFANSKNIFELYLKLSYDLDMPLVTVKKKFIAYNSYFVWPLSKIYFSKSAYANQHWHNQQTLCCRFK